MGWTMGHERRGGREEWQGVHENESWRVQGGGRKGLSDGNWWAEREALMQVADGKLRFAYSVSVAQTWTHEKFAQTA